MIWRMRTWWIGCAGETMIAQAAPVASLMPLLFVVAGSGIWHLLGTRTPARFARERLSRLLVPLVTGMLLIVPPQLYYSMLADVEAT